MEHIKLTLFRVKLECRRCRHVWRALRPWPGDRYHIYMRCGDLYAFVLDDIWYGLQTEPFDIASILHKLSFDYLADPCPFCGAPPTVVRRVRGLLTAHLPLPSEDVSAVELTPEDFERGPHGWDLKPDVRAALAQ